MRSINLFTIKHKIVQSISDQSEMMDYYQYFQENEIPILDLTTSDYPYLIEPIEKVTIPIKQLRFNPQFKERYKDKLSKYNLVGNTDYFAVDPTVELFTDLKYRQSQETLINNEIKSLRNEIDKLKKNNTKLKEKIYIVEEENKKLKKVKV